MNNELRDPLEKISNSLRRAVSINKSKETDLRTTVNTIQRERRRSFNTWSLKQEKFLRAKQNLVPTMLYEQASQIKGTKTGDSQDNNPRERRVTIVRAVAPVRLAATNRSKSPDVNLPNIKSHSKDGGRKKKSNSEVLPSVITLANSSQFFHECNGIQRISDHKQALTTSFTTETSSRQLQPQVTVNDIAPFICSKKRLISQHYQSTFQPERTANAANKEKTTKETMPDITEERNMYTNSQSSSERCLTANDSGDFLTPITKTEKNDERAKAHWKKVRDAVGKITGQKQKTNLNKLSMIELTKLFEEIRECRYLRFGNQSNLTANDCAVRGSDRCKCLACTVKDKNKLKNHLSAPE